MDALLRLFLYWRDSTGRWAPTGWGSRLTLAAGLVLLAWIAWDGIRQVRRGEKKGRRTIWWAAFGFVIWALFIAPHACRLWSPQWIAIQAATVVGGIAWAVVGFRKGYPARGDEDGETGAALEASAAAEEPPREDRARQEERSARERLHDRARAVQGEAARRRTEPWRRLSRVCYAAERLSLQVVLFSALVACACEGLGMLWGDPDVLGAWFVRALVWQACLAGFAGLAWLAARAADWRLAGELDRLEPPRADPAG